MNNELLQYSYLELKKHTQLLQKREKEMQQSLLLLKRKIQGLNYVLDKHDEELQTWMVQIPADLVVLDVSSTGIFNKWNWKAIVMELFTKYDQPMTTEMLYSKYLITYENPSRNRKFVIQNISAALHYLVNVDEKLARFKGGSKKSYLYGLYEYFEDTGKLKENYYDKVLLEM